MNREVAREICLTQPEASEDFPFGDHVSAFKVGGKMFALLPVKSETVSLTLKCDPVAKNLLRSAFMVPPDFVERN